MTDAFVSGSFIDQVGGRKFNTWHRKEDVLGVERIVAGDTVTVGMDKGRILDVECVKAPMFIHVGDTVVQSGKTQLVLTNCWWKDNGIQLLDRSVSWYEPIQNRQYASILDPLTETYQLVGTFMCGTSAQILVVQMEMPSFYVNDMPEEEHHCFLTVTEDRQSGQKNYGVSFTRVVCENTYMMAINGGLRSLPNSINSDLMLQFRTEVELAMIQRREEEHSALNKMFVTPVTTEKIEAVAVAMFPLPKRPQSLDLFERAIESGYDMTADNQVAQFATKKFATAKQVYESAMARHEERTKEFFVRVNQFNDEHPYAAGTEYGVMQAVTGFWNHYEGFRGSEDMAQFNLLFGDRNAAIQEAVKVLR